MAEPKPVRPERFGDIPETAPRVLRLPPRYDGEGRLLPPQEGEELRREQEAKEQE